MTQRGAKTFREIIGEKLGWKKDEGCFMCFCCLLRDLADSLVLCKFIRVVEMFLLFVLGKIYLFQLLEITLVRFPLSRSLFLFIVDFNAAKACLCGKCLQIV